MSHRSFSGAYSRFALSVGTVAQAKAWMSVFDTIRPPVRAEQSACAAAVSNQAEGGWADVLVDSMGGAVNQVRDCFFKESNTELDKRVWPLFGEICSCCFTWIMLYKIKLSL